MDLGGIHAVVTQLGECKTEDLEVAGSSPAHGTILLKNSERNMTPIGFEGHRMFREAV